MKYVVKTTDGKDLVIDDEKSLGKCGRCDNPSSGIIFRLCDSCFYKFEKESTALVEANGGKPIVPTEETLSLISEQFYDRKKNN